MDTAAITSNPQLPTEALGKSIILVDGLCVCCNRLVATIARHDKAGRFFSVHIQTPLAQAILTRNQHDPDDIDTIYLVTDAGTERERLHLDGTAGRLIWPALFRIAVVLRFVPLALLNLQYRIFARIRYRLFGASDACIVPSAELRARVLSAPSLPAPSTAAA